MKFKLDENIPFSLRNAIFDLNNNHQVDSVYHENKCGIKDDELLRLCLNEKRVLITLDTDFINAFLHPKSTLFSIIILRPGSQGKYAVINLFKPCFHTEICYKS